MSNAIFAPNFNPLIPGNEQVYVINFWNYYHNLQTPGYGGFFPQGMARIIDIDNSSIRLNPNSAIQKMTKNEYDELIRDKKIELAQIFLDNAILDEFTLTLTLVGVQINGPTTLQQLIKENSPLFQDGSLFNDFLPVAIPVVSDRVLLEIEDLFGTYCMYNSDGALIECDKCLPHEAKYMKTLDFYISSEEEEEEIPVLNMTSVIFFQHPKIVPPGSTLPITTTAPSCELCSSYVVYCDISSILPDLIVASGNPPTEVYGLKLEESGKNFSGYPNNSKFFHTKKEAEDYYNSLIIKDPKWVCWSFGMGDEQNIPARCYPVSDLCLESFAAIIDPPDIYDSEQQCEENCNKLWYCIEYQCVKIDKDDSMVIGEFGYETQEDCELVCETPSASSSSS